MMWSDLIDNKVYFRICLVFMFAIVICLPVSANSVEDNSGVTWTVTREYNASSSGYDIKVTTDEFPIATYWITSDALGDKDPWIAIDPDTDYPVVVWSKTVMGGNRIRISWYDGSDFGSPQTVTSGGTQFGDVEPHMAIESDGDIQLVFCRKHTSADDEAYYTNYTGSWSTLEEYSVDGDDVSGSCKIKIVDESEGELEAEYLYDGSTLRSRCKDGSDPNPWESCS